ncbi:MULTISPECIES: hypothetical protein [unclassified Pseudomonas]|uniref:hypothetical protein n=1 Tax=unclassified Pseudomonas TaxID=196821 RepID=UPI0021150719|nr:MULTISPECIES: hypothetical protein [unclassified Pseudomonas]
MTWYKTGTVAVTPGSNAVLGTETSFIANARVGDAFRGPDGEWYEVTNIASDTAISIAPNYQGAAEAAGGYSLAPMQGYVKDSADALRAATQVIVSGVADMQEQVAAATEAAQSAGQSKAAATEQADIATAAAQASSDNKNAAQLAAQQSQNSAQASGAAADRSETARDSIVQSEQAAAASAAAAKDSADRAEEVTEGKASSGANSDITSLSGLTTPLSIAQGGNGGNATPYMPVADANAQMNNGMYSTQNAWTGSPFPGTDSRNYGYLEHVNWTDNAQVQFQRWSSINSTVKEMFRRKLGGAWTPWVEIASVGDVTALASNVNQQGAAIADIQSKQIITKKWTGSAVTVTAGAPMTISHNLGIPAKIIRVTGTILTAAGGYSIGDTIDFGSCPVTLNGSLSFNYTFYNSANNSLVAILGSSGIALNNKTTGAVTSLAASQVSIVFEVLA